MGRLSVGTAPWNFTDIPDSAEPNDPPADFMRMATRIVALLQGIGNRLTALESDSGWVQAGICTAADGWSIEAQSARRMRKWASVGISARRTGPTITVPATGDIANLLVGTLTPAWAPPNAAVGLVSPPMSVAAAGRVSALAALRDGGGIYLAASSGGDIPSGTLFTIGGAWWVS